MAVRLQRSRLRTLALPIGIATIGLALIIFGFLRPLPTYLIAARDLAPGELVTAADVSEVELDLGPIASGYLSELPLGQATSGFVAAGELLPKRLLGDYQLPTQTLIRIVPQSPPAAAVRPGTLVSIWQVREVEEILQPERLVELAEVVAIIEPDGLFAADLPELELRMSKEQATAVITAVAGDIPLFVMPTS